MKIKKILIAVLSLAILGAVGLVGLTGCGGGLEPPTDFTFELATRAYSFTTASGADSYQITIEKILNDATGKSLHEGATIQREEKGSTITQPADAAAAPVTKPGNDASKYVWSWSINNTMNIKDNAGAGKVSGNLSIYKFQSQADGVTPVLLNGNPEELPLGHYYVSCYSFDAEGNRSEPAWKEFVVGGKLANPDYSYSVKNGKMTIKLSSTYIDTALLTAGLPESVDFEIDDGSGTKKTVSFNDWAYYSTVIGPTTSFNYMFLEKEIDVAASENYSVKATAKGDGDKIKDSDTVEMYCGSETSFVPSDYLASGTTDLTGTATGGMTVALKLDEANGKFAVEGYTSTSTGSGPDAVTTYSYFGGAWGTYEGATFTIVGGGDFLESVTELSLTGEGNGRTGTAKVSVKHSDRANSAQTVTVQKRQQGGGGFPGGPGGGPM